MNKAIDYFPFVDNEDPRHLKTVSELGPDAVAFQHAGLETTDPGFEPEQLGEIPLDKPKGSVKAAAWVAYVHGSVQVVTFKIAIGNFILRHVRKDHSNAALFDGGPVL